MDIPHIPAPLPRRTNSHSGSHTNCVEVTAPAWHTSSYSSPNGECVEVSEGPVTGVRDSKHRDHAVLAFPHTEWHAFLAAATHDEL